jgi:hypothetical protein
MHPTNPVDLQKRIMLQPTSPQGEKEQISITNPSQIKQIQEWRKAREQGIRLPRGFVVETQVQQNNHAPQPSLSMSESKPAQEMPAFVSKYNVAQQGPPPAPNYMPPVPQGMAKAPVRPPPRRQGPPPVPANAALPPVPSKQVAPARANFLGSIQSFNKNNLQEVKERQMSVADEVNDVLKKTLSNYRNFVMAEDDDEGASDPEWE